MRSWSLLIGTTLGLALGLAPAHLVLAQQPAQQPIEPGTPPDAEAAIGAAPVPPAQDATGMPDSGALPEMSELPEAGGQPISEVVSQPQPAQTVPEAAPTADAEIEKTVPVAGDPSAGFSFSERPTSSSVLLGPIGVDSSGRRGRIHTVRSGDTLWDVSEVYLGTPWVWPSIWNDNREIANPHLISPGDQIWITSSEMRPVTPEEAVELISQAAPEEVFEASPVAEIEDIPEIEEFELTEDVEVVEEIETVEVDDSLAMDQFPVSFQSARGDGLDTGRSVRVSSREAMGFITARTLDAASSIVGSPVPRSWLAQGDTVYLGLGEGEVRVGDQFTVFRDIEPVYDINESTLGFHVRVLGWVEVKEVQEESSIAEVRLSVAEIGRGDSVVPRDPPPLEVAIRAAPESVEGRIVYMPDDRSVMGGADYVYLNRGTIDGLEIGSELEVYEGGRVAVDFARFNSVKTPDRSVAKLVVVSLKPETSVAFVTHAGRELEVGDIFRAAHSKLARR